MAVSANDVYRTVLLILNKEQRGYMTPEEFNKIASQVQKEIFEKYFEDLNQVIRAPQTDLDYASRLSNLDEKMQIFKKDGVGSYTVGPQYLLLFQMTYTYLGQLHMKKQIHQDYQLNFKE